MQVIEECCLWRRTSQCPFFPQSETQINEKGQGHLALNLGQNMQINSKTPELNWLRPELPTTASGALNLQGTMEIVLHRIQGGERQRVCRQREDEDDKDRELVEPEKGKVLCFVSGKS